MKKLIKLSAFFIFVLIALLVAGIAIIKSQDYNAYRSLIAEQVKAATGRDLTIAGDLELELSLAPALSVEGVTFENAAWGSRPDMVRLDRLAAVVELLPLLQGDVRVEWLELSGVDVLVETDVSGHGNWQFESKVPEAEQATGDNMLPVVKSVRMEDVTLMYRDGVAGTERAFVLREVDLAADDPDSPLKLKIEAKLDGEEFEANGTLGAVSALLDNKVFPIRIQAEAFGTDIDLAGSINRPREAKGYNLNVALTGKSLKDSLTRVLTLAGTEKAPPMADRSFGVAGTLRDDGDRLAIEDLVLGVGDSDLTGSLSLVPTSPRLDLIATLTSNRLALADFVEPGERDRTVAAEPSDGRVFSADPLPIDAIKGTDAQLTLNVAALVLDDLQLDHVSAVLRLQNGRLSLDPFGVNVDGRAVSGAVDLNAAAMPATVELSLAGREIDYGWLVAEATGDRTLAGELDLDLDVAGQGQSIRSIMASASGNLRIVTRDGRIESGALSFMSGDVLGAVPFLGGGEDTRALKCGVIDFAISDGIAVPRALLIETGGLNVIGTGEVDLREEKLNLLFDPRAKNTSLLKAAEIGVRVTGTLLEPEFGPDAGSVVKNVTSTALGIATGGLSTLAEMAIGTVKSAVDDTDYCAAALSGKMPEQGASGTSGSNEPASEAAQQEDAGAESGVDGLGGTLNNLFGN